jgi:hypothetical protein
MVIEQWVEIVVSVSIPFTRHHFLALLPLSVFKRISNGDSRRIEEEVEEEENEGARRVVDRCVSLSPIQLTMITTAVMVMRKVVMVMRRAMSLRWAVAVFLRVSALQCLAVLFSAVRFSPATSALLILLEGL